MEKEAFVSRHGQVDDNSIIASQWNPEQSKRLRKSSKPSLESETGIGPTGTVFFVRYRTKWRFSTIGEDWLT